MLSSPIKSTTVGPAYNSKSRWCVRCAAVSPTTHHGRLQDPCQVADAVGFDSQTFPYLFPHHTQRTGTFRICQVRNSHTNQNATRTRSLPRQGPCRSNTYWVLLILDVNFPSRYRGRSIWDTLRYMYVDAGIAHLCHKRCNPMCGLELPACAGG